MLISIAHNFKCSSWSHVLETMCVAAGCIASRRGESSMSPVIILVNTGQCGSDTGRRRCQPSRSHSRIHRYHRCQV
jgi:hypothetical protein